MKIGPIISKPGSSIGNKTGSWRTGLKPKFLKKDCNACNLCYILCPEICVFGQPLDTKRFKKATYDCDYDYCKGCGICSVVCPVKDIEMIEE